MTEARDKLGTMATEINVRLGKAEGYDGRAETALQKADDHRLAAALQLAEARMLADAHHIGWKRWVDKHIDRSYRDVKRLVAIGSAQDPVLALESARKHGRDAKARSRGRDGGVIGNRAPAPPDGQQPASEDKSPRRNGEVRAIKAKLDRLTPEDVQTILSYAIRCLLDPKAQRKLAKGLNAMIAREYTAIGRTDPVPETATPEGKKVLLDVPMTEADIDYFTIPESFRRSKPKEKTDG